MRANAHIRRLHGLPLAVSALSLAMIPGCSRATASSEGAPGTWIVVVGTVYDRTQHARPQCVGEIRRFQRGTVR